MPVGAHKIGWIAETRQPHLTPEALDALASVADTLAIGVVHLRSEEERAALRARDRASCAEADASLARFKFLGDAIPHQVWTAGPDGALDYVNQRALDYFDQTFERMIGDG